MATAAALVAIIAAASGGEEFPARIGTNATALASVAESRFGANENLLSICQYLEASTDTGTYAGHAKSFNDDDAMIIAFFLAENTAMSRLLCVQGARVLHAVGKTTARWLTRGSE